MKPLSLLFWDKYLSLNNESFIFNRVESEARGQGGDTNAEGENVSGGNINIDTDFLAAFDNSDISANSENARGGNVTINATGIFGIGLRDRPTPLSDITATGATSALSGNVQLNIEQVELNRGLVELPAQVVDISGLIVSGCRATTEGSSFIVTGRGGLLPTPQQELDDDPAWRDRRLVGMRGKRAEEVEGVSYSCSISLRG
ncbi:hypothetical protein [Chroococcidiopsis sp.]|uniref:hypothetical protein n=1 Tax=Chroococcidiopsis sp. TaxID=3088168 RepID=UPI003F2C420A